MIKKTKTTAQENMESTAGMAEILEYKPSGKQQEMTTKKSRKGKFQKFQMQRMAGPGE